MFDEKFVQLIQAGGPELQAELFLRLQQDLSSVRQGLVTAAQNSDWQGLHDSTHVLLSLSGTIGATRLYNMAKQINSQSEEIIGRDTTLPSVALPSLAEMMRETDGLIAAIASYSTGSSVSKSSK